MIWKFVKKYLLLILAVASFTLAGIQYFSAPPEQETAELNYSEAVQESVTESLQTAGRELAEVTKIYQDGNELSFTNLNIETEFPFYVFKNRELIYWSDHRYTPDHQSIQGFYDDGLLAQKNHIHLVRKQDFFHNQDKIELVSLIPVFIEYEHENDYLKSHFNNKLFKASPLSIKNTASSKAHLNIHDQKDRFLFSVEPPRYERLYSSNLSDKALGFLVLGFLLLGLCLLTRIRSVFHKHGFEYSLALIIIYVVVVRWFMLANSIPYSLYEIDLFNPKYFAVNAFTPSLGDLIVNTLCFTLIALFIAYRFHKSALYRNIIKSGIHGRSVISVITILLSTAVTYCCHKALIYLYEKSNYMLDFSVSTSFDNIKLGVLAFYVFLAILFFLSQHLLIGIFLRLNNRHKSGLAHWVYGVILSAIILLFVGEPSWVLLIGAFYFLISYWFKFPLYLYTLKYRTSIFFFLGAFVFTLISIQVLHHENRRKAAFDKLNFGKQFLAENDALGEGLLGKVILSIKSDSAIQNAIQRPTLAREAVSSLVKENHLELYFDKYDTEVYSFKPLGEQLGFEENLPSLQELENQYKKPNYQTTNANIFFIDETGEKFIKQYVVFIPLERGGTVVLDMKQRNANKKSVYPELLMEKKLSQSPEIKPFSYAIYDDKNELIYSGGKYNYHKYGLTDYLKNDQLFSDGIQFNGFNHLGVTNDTGRKIIVSTNDHLWKSLLSDFSFLYLVLVSVIFVVILFYAFSFGLRKLKMNFSTKIQVYLNAAFLLPFMLLLFVTIGIIRSTLLNIQEGFYFENTQNISSTFRIHLQNLKEGRYSEAFFEQEINKLAQDTRSDINYFNEQGKLVYSSRPLIYEYNLLSKCINPGAYRAIVEENENEILLSEKLGDLEYRAAYMTIKDSQNERLGIIGVPFFNSSTALESQLKEVFTTILSICIALFLALLVLSYYASGQLTNPLKMVAQKIKRISLNEVNEPIHWEADDEIGVLTGSYNQMLKKLEESKDALSQSEKQTAWREMARQVAHEIKNPLTPMKLSIQQLQRTLPTLEDTTRGRIERSLNSLTEQIDNISEIANSFSEFAKMPVPRSEVFELGTVVQRTAYLYAQDNGLDINIDIKDQGLMVRSDHQLINRVVTNLIINGIQSVPEDRKPQIEVKVYGHHKDKFAIIEVKDNGSGIPEENREKVFMPNFSTKVDGSGLGLAMAKRGVEHSGGNIWFETDENKGTTFYVDLPLVRKA
ncbi:HAMP domain-containing sensor histidine kinase [Jiulongibacter sediminis]|jgi:signal transduction histidine kinase|uniref:sensor histidine kinase n=1 Tax=Jiulongibacter sediminis TaxID=1605367 RepID=UPI0026E988D1|nr:HAMP domain-containing sensor histidine kinase [Jiulongibacter sediminis]